MQLPIIIYTSIYGFEVAAFKIFFFLTWAAETGSPHVMPGTTTRSPTPRIRLGGPGAGVGDRLPVLPKDGSGPEVWDALARYEAKRIQRVFKYLVPILSVAILAQAD